MEILKMLEQDHRKVEKILEELMQTTGHSTAKRKELLLLLKQELKLHEQIEEEQLYPKLKRADKDKVLEAYEEHHVVDQILAELEEMATNDEMFKAKVKVLQENLQHHIEEEEGEIFPKAKEVLGHQKLEAIGKEAKKIKEKELIE